MAVRPHAPIHIGDRTYSYDFNGNQLGWTQDTNGTRRTLVWDEENRIESVSDNGQEQDYKYDDQGTRTIKRGTHGETVYVNQFYTQRPGATATKHVYAGTIRIVSKLVKQDIPGANPQGSTPFEKDLFFYHPDHLGSSNYVTNTNGKIYEHLEYFPFGETWVEENSNTQRTPYLFTAKELDEETGLYYFGARYYDPRTSVWQSGDPILGQYLEGKPNQGVFNQKNLALYSYSANNPAVFADPDGKCYVGNGYVDCVGVSLAAQEMLLQGVVGDVQQGNYGMAAAGALLYVANTVNVAAGYAAQAIVEPGNATYMATSGFIEGDYDKALYGSVETALIFGGARLLEPVAPANPAKSVERGGGEPPQLSRGRRAHEAEPVRPGEIKEARTPSGKRMDRYDPEKRHIREIKTDNPRQMKLGEKTVQDYKKEMDSAKPGKPHTTEVSPYDPKKYE